jgi:hypothetical protein
MKHNYTKCYISGEGKVLNNGMNFIVEDVSAVEADVLSNYKLSPDKVYDIEIRFTTKLIEQKIKTKAIFEDEKFIHDEYYYKAVFVNMPEFTKIEIDEILQSACIVKEKFSINKCEYGECKLSQK